MDTWTLRYEGFDAAREGQREALCTLGNGYLATRGAAPECPAGPVHYPGTYLAGCYNRLRDTVAGEVVENESLVNVTNWLPLSFRAGDGPWLGQPGVTVTDQRWELDLRRGTLTRHLRVRDSAGRASTVRQRRFVHMRRPHVCGLQTTVTPEDWSGALTVRSWLDASVDNAGVARYRTLSGRHLRPLRVEPVDDTTVLCEVETNQSHIRVATAARTRLRSPDEVAVTRTTAREPGRVGHELCVEVAPGDRITVEKLVTVYTSRDAATSTPALAVLDELGRLPDFDALLEEHALAWRHLWRRFAVCLGGAARRALPVVRLHLFHLLQSVSHHTVEVDAGVPARGLHGEAYRGHVLWDELFVLPVFNLRTSLVSRAMLRYRYRRLPAARAAARAEGRVGARYPWQSGSDGREESQRLHLNPLSGRWLPDPTRLQRHVGLAVAYNTWQYYQATADREFLSHYGAEMILEVARYFADLAEYDHGRDRYVIRGVMGPDEFHSAYPDSDRVGIDNNAYTNVLTVWVLLRALEVLRELPRDRLRELTGALGLTAVDTQRWEDITRRMYVPVRPDGIVDQFEGYHRLAELDWEGYRRRHRDIRRLDRILESEGDTPNRYQASKQADVLMLFYLLSTEELTGLFDRLGYRLTPESVAATVEYYLARTSGGSTLSAVVHAWVLARLRRARALEYFVEALASDVADVQGGTTAEGIHLGAMAGSVDVLQRCFAGVETRGDTLWLDPYWPPSLGTLHLRVRYRELPLDLRISGESVRVTAGAGRQAAVRLCCRGEVAVVGPGEVLTLPAV